MVYAALLISVCALSFTVASFWWLNARSGELVSFEPLTWAASFGWPHSPCGVRLSVLLFNSGAIPVVVPRMRLVFVDEDCSMEWEETRKTVNPGPDDVDDVAAPFSVMPRSTARVIANFNGTFPGVVPEQRPYPIAVETMTSGGEWKSVLTMTLDLQNFVHPEAYIVYTNDADCLTPEELNEGETRWASLRERHRLSSEKLGSAVEE